MFLTCAKQTAKKFDPVEVVLLLKSMSLGCTMVTLRSETLLYMSTPHRLVVQNGGRLNLDCECHAARVDTNGTNEISQHYNHEVTTEHRPACKTPQHILLVVA